MGHETRAKRDVKLPTTILMKINVFFVSLDIIRNASGIFVWLL